AAAAVGSAADAAAVAAVGSAAGAPVAAAVGSAADAAAVAAAAVGSAAGAPVAAAVGAAADAAAVAAVGSAAGAPVPGAETAAAVSVQSVAGAAAVAFVMSLHPAWRVSLPAAALSATDDPVASEASVGSAEEPQLGARLLLPAAAALSATADSGRLANCLVAAEAGSESRPPSARLRAAAPARPR